MIVGNLNTVAIDMILNNLNTVVRYRAYNKKDKEVQHVQLKDLMITCIRLDTHVLYLSYQYKSERFFFSKKERTEQIICGEATSTQFRKKRIRKHVKYQYWGNAFT